MHDAYGAFLSTPNNSRSPSQIWRVFIRGRCAYDEGYDEPSLTLMKMRLT